ncbi:MAG TPA: DegV family protein [Mycobacteriales bacterium]|jgi:DegV family protein with EDD domain|nr:DegV family protein [Mycobacteriales bacterium]
MDGPRVAVVTDSTAYLPAGLAERLGVAVVPLHVVTPEGEALEGVELTPGEFAAWLSRSGGTASTRPPTAAAFRAVYEAAGAPDIVSIHLSARLSGTRESAVTAAYDLFDAGGPRVKVVDSRTTAMGLGFAVLAAAEIANAGGDAFEVATAAEASARRTATMFYVDTLEYLRRGGRIGKAAALVGTALSVKPLLHLVDGAIEPMDRVRKADRALARLEDALVKAAGDGPVDVAVHHLAAADGARALAERLRARLPGLHALHESEVGAVVGAHVGPGLLGAVVHRRA